MTNEEKILEMLEGLTRSVSGIDSRLERLETGQAVLEGRMGRLETTMAEQGELLQKVDERSQRTAVMLEADVLPRLQSLYEGHQAIMAAITPKEQIEEMAADISVLRMASRTHSQEIAELKKAR